MAEPWPVFTVGYEQAPLSAVLEALRTAGVELLVDVRAVTASRRPGFAKRQLAAALAEVGVDYLHLRALGTPAAGRTAARAGRYDELARIYAGQLATLEAQAELAELAGLVRARRRVCLLCYERAAAQCHRRLIAERLAVELPVRIHDLVPTIGTA